jgi:hypothetical protein
MLGNLKDKKKKTIAVCRIITQIVKRVKAQEILKDQIFVLEN